mmetsp:Transcript_63408/g.185400  ORF Transcript_63408/g.185400 Transcript_63408/m.185400 type:complete len:220 (+) Transcript_63408:162-821(+)
MSTSLGRSLRSRTIPTSASPPPPPSRLPCGTSPQGSRWNRKRLARSSWRTSRRGPRRRRRRQAPRTCSRPGATPAGWGRSPGRRQADVPPLSWSRPPRVWWSRREACQPRRGPTLQRSHGAATAWAPPCPCSQRCTYSRPRCLRLAPRRPQAAACALPACLGRPRRSRPPSRQATERSRPPPFHASVPPPPAPWSPASRSRRHRRCRLQCPLQASPGRL